MDSYAIYDNCLWYIDKRIKRIIKVDLNSGETVCFSEIIQSESLEYGKGIIFGSEIRFISYTDGSQIIYDTKNNEIRYEDFHIDVGLYYSAILHDNNIYVFPFRNKKGIAKISIGSGKTSFLIIPHMADELIVGNVERYQDEYLFTMAFDSRVMRFSPYDDSIRCFIELEKTNGLADTIVNGKFIYILEYVNPIIYKYDLDKRECIDKAYLHYKGEDNLPFIKLFKYLGKIYVFPSTGRSICSIKMESLETEEVAILPERIVIKYVFQISNKEVLLISNKVTVYHLFNFESNKLSEIRIKGLPINDEVIYEDEYEYELEDYLNSIARQ